MKTKLVMAAAVFLSSVVATRSESHAESGKDRVVARGQLAKALPGWPQGVLELINHPVRVNGWHPWFSECANDGCYYEMDVRGPEDVNHLIKILAEHFDDRCRPTTSANYGDFLFGIHREPVFGSKIVKFGNWVSRRNFLILSLPTLKPLRL